ncbi:MAG: RNA methyltransferase [Gammaproteobacteria bacterium]|nr:RNA methyltransferase [Gammaproteobacteria bacterium]
MNNLAPIAEEVAQYFPQIRIVLVETSHPGNIGGVARAMKNMGLRDLVLVNPLLFPDEQATSRASGAEDLLHSAVVVSDLVSAIAGCRQVIGASARLRSLPLPIVTPRQTAALLSQPPFSREDRVAVVFGRERSGLTNDELASCNSLLHIPTSPDFSSLNLAAAVQVVCYEFFVAASDTTTIASRVNFQRQQQAHELAMADDIERFYEHLEKTLWAVEFFDPNHPGQLMRRIRRLFNRVALERVELNILRGILSAVMAKIHS